MSEKPLDTIQAIYQRRAVRAFAPEPLAEDTIRALLRAAVQAPTAVHEEPWVFAVVQDRGFLKQLSARVQRTLEQGEHHGSHFARLFAEPGFNCFYDAGTLVVIAVRPLGPFVAADAWLAAENLMLAACATGLGTCVIGLAVDALNHPEVKAQLRLPDEVTVVAPIIVGVPRVAPQAVPRTEPVVSAWLR